MEHIPLSASGRLGFLKDKDAIAREKKRIEEKKAQASSLILRHIVEKKDLATAYSEVFPESPASRKQKKKQAGKLIKWFRLNFPIAIRQLLWLKGYDDDKIIDLVGEQLQATTQLKKRTLRWKEKRDDGTTVWIEEIDYIEVPDNKIRADAVQKLITLSGHHARRNLKPSAKEAAAEEGRPVPEPPPMKIPPRKKLPPDEWQKEYQRVLEESNASGRADKMLRDLERRVAEAEAANGNVTHGPPFPPAGLPPPNVSN